MPRDYRFSFGPWNIHEGSDPFGPTVRPTIAFATKLKEYKKLGFEGVQLHDDDAVPDVDSKSSQQVEKDAKQLAGMLKDEGLVAEFVAPRLVSGRRRPGGEVGGRGRGGAERAQRHGAADAEAGRGARRDRGRRRGRGGGRGCREQRDRREAGRGKQDLGSHRETVGVEC